VDGLDFSDDKMLVGRTFSYSDTQRYRVGPNYLQLPVNAPKAPVATNQRDGQMAYAVDHAPGQNPHVNYEPSITGGVQETPKGEDYQAEVGPEISARLTRARIERTNDYKQAGERFQLQEEWEKEELIANLVDALSQCDRPIQERMVWHFYMVEDEMGRRVGDGIGVSLEDVKDLGPLATQRLSEEELQRVANLGNNGPRSVAGLTMTHCVPNEHVAVEREPQQASPAMMSS
jgi:catalase